MHPLKAFRRKHNLTQLQVIELFGISQSFISDIERGKRNVSTDIAKKIEKATNGEIKAEWLLLPEKYKEEIEKYVGQEL